MQQRNGLMFILIGTAHTLLGLSPWGFGNQFWDFSSHLFFRISSGILEFPLFDGQMDYESFAAFWFFYFGLLLFPIGLLVRYLEKQELQLPRSFVLSYLLVILLGAYMIPLSGMTFFMLPHALFMMWQLRKNQAKQRGIEPG